MEEKIVKINTMQRWSNIEEEVLKQNYKTTHIKDMLKLFPNRNENSIRRKAFRMGISQDMNLLYIHHPSIYKNINGVIYKKCKECEMFIEMNGDNFWEDNTTSGYKNTCKKCLIVNIDDDYFSNIAYTKYASWIYRITNLVNGKIYIGSAVDLIDRKKTHISKLNNGNHENEYLQRSWIKYRQDSFKFEIIELVENKDNLIEREQYWIDSTRCCDRSIGYNLCPVAGSSFGTKSTEDTIFKLKYENPQSIEIIQCDINGNFIKLWISSRDITRKTNYDCSSIIKCCKHKTSFAYGSLWFYKKEYSDNNFNINIFINIAKKNKTSKVLDFKIEQYSKDGEYIKTWNNIREISECLDISEKGILRCCENIANFHTYKKFIWKMIG